MRAAGKRVLFLTNNSSKSREQYAAKLDALGFGGSADEVVASSYLAAA
jgi:phosphoglycolate phosphatase